ncbi:MAG: hypothetical protein Q8P84_05070 [Deltaproteobacteria bacterium]|nr:hypothetical protein [Deltaproteobacteria bacterium]
MPRIIFEKGEQKNFLVKARAMIHGQVDSLAMVCNVHPRTLRDWIREKYRMPESAFDSINHRLKIKAVPSIRVIPDYEHVSRAGRQGALKRNALYGSPGTKEGRSKGGRTSCFVQQEAFNRGVISGFMCRKDIHLPPYSEELAEAIGVILGDGSISKFQVSISVSALVDQKYSKFLVQLFKRLFYIKVVKKEVEKNTIRLTLSSRQLVEWLIQMGLVVGDKIRQNVKIPNWIIKDEKYLKTCLRGLFDTDGCVYYHHHFVNGREYNDIGWEFSNLNKNFLNVFYNFLLQKGLRAKLGSRRVVLYNRKDINSYFQEVKTNNPKHVRRYQQYFEKIRRGG